MLFSKNIGSKDKETVSLPQFSRVIFIFAPGSKRQNQTPKKVLKIKLYKYDLVIYR